MKLRLLEFATNFLAQNGGKLLRWLFAGLVFMFLSTGFLYLFVDILKINMWLATLLTAESSTLLRFVVNSYWVFKVRKLSFRECWQYHLANAGSFLIWWCSTNLLVLFGVNYLLAGILSIGLSVSFSLYSNFYWVWRIRR
jgi:putative flippase GtrA